MLIRFFALVCLSGVVGVINQIPKIDTSSLSNRINNKISLGSLSSNDITQALNYTPVSDDYGSFYDTTKQQTAAATALSIKFNFSL